MRKVDGLKKDSLVDVELTKEFIINLVTEEVACERLKKYFISLT